MRTKWRALFIAGVMALMMALLVGCAGAGEKLPVTPPDDTDKTSEYGELSIEDVKVNIDQYKHYTFAEIEPVFSKPEKAEELTYTYDTDKIKIEGNVVTPLKRTDEVVNVRAESEHFNVIFRVKVEVIRYSGDNAPMETFFDTSRFSGQIVSLAEKCRAINEDTTLFIGDSFMDDYFIGEYMQTYAADKEGMHAGISSTTSYHWEAVFEDIIGDTAPKNIVLHIGTNNFYDARDGVEFTEASLTRLMMYLHTTYPTSNIWWFNITQRTDTSFAEEVSETNDYMAEWCAQYDWITCVDTCSKISAGMLKDGIHPKTENYKVFTDALAEAGCEIVTK